VNAMLAVADLCRTFGPTPPMPKPGEPNARPADPDFTGGYYQPVRVLAPGESKNAHEYAVGVTRLQCGLPGATQDQAARYAKQHRPNQNPALAELALVRGHETQTIVQAGMGDPVAVKPGATLALRASWMECPKDPICGDGLCSPGEDKQSCADDCGMASRPGCSGAEPYLALDPVDHTLASRREAIRVSWFATDGSFEHERTGRAETDHASTSDNRWTAPRAHGVVQLWVVIRDDRGGVGWSAYAFDVEP
jgi:hypothetical protein